MCDSISADVKNDANGTETGLSGNAFDENDNHDESSLVNDSLVKGDENSDDPVRYICSFFSDCFA